jgi:tetratricopeptide (TPR) repeat protein
MSSRGPELLEEGRFEEALACFDGDDVRSSFGRGVALQLLGRFEAASEAYELVLSADPKHQETLANLIAMHVERFDLPCVEHYSRRLLAVAPNSQIALRGLIVVAVERRDFDLAARYFAKLTPAEESCRDSIEYRLSRQIVDRLKDHHGSAAHSY